MPFNPVPQGRRMANFGRLRKPFGAPVPETDCELPALYSSGCQGRAWRDLKGGAVTPRLVEPAAGFFTMCKITMVR